MSGVFASSLALRPSRWRHLAYVLAVTALFTVGLSLPLAGWQLALCAMPLLLVIYQLLQQWQVPLSNQVLTVQPDGQLHWLGDSQPKGTLLRSSLICGWGVWLHWQDEQQQPRQLWLYRDNFSESDFRALARHCQLVRWQSGHRQSVP